MIRLTNRRQTHPYHIVSRSPWPWAISLTLCGLTTSVVVMLHLTYSITLALIFSFLALFVVFSAWQRDVLYEAVCCGSHTSAVQKGLRLGMKLFIISEVMFFASLFWAFFHAALAPSVLIGGVWPPYAIMTYYGILLEQTKQQ